MMKDIIAFEDATIDVINEYMKHVDWIGFIILPDNVQHMNMYEVDKLLLPDIYNDINIEKLFIVSESGIDDWFLYFTRPLNIKTNKLYLVDCKKYDIVMSNKLETTETDNKVYGVCDLLNGCAIIKLNSIAYLIQFSAAERNI